MKKQLAVLMAAATAVTTVAPVVANAETVKSTVTIDAAVAAAKAAFTTKYSDKKQDGIKAPADTATAVETYQNYTKGVVVVFNKDASTFVDANFVNVSDATTGYDLELVKAAGVTAVDKETYVLKNADSLYNVIEAFKEKSDANTVKVYVVDKGVKDQKSYRETPNYVYEAKTGNDATNDKKQVTLNSLTKEAVGKILPSGVDASKTDGYLKSVVAYVGDTKYEGTTIANKLKTSGTYLDDKLIDKVVITLLNGTELTYKAGDDAIDLAKFLVGDKVYDVESISASTEFVNATGFKAKDLGTEDDNNTQKVDLPTGDVNEYTVTTDTVIDQNVNVGTIYTEADGYTKDGAKLVNTVGSALKAVTDNKEKKTVNVAGKTYIVDSSQVDVKKGSTIEKSGDGYLLTVPLKVTDKNDTQRNYVVAYKITGKTYADLQRVLSDILAGREVVAGHFNRLYGDDRYQTAIEISKESFEEDGSADSVVIVGGNALLDGLSAAPLASAKNATMLLASPKTGLSQATIDEISRATDNKLKNKTVYVVGGVDSVPASVDKVLADKFGAVVVRISGDDRYATSKEVAERLYFDGLANKRVFYVGGNGAADAMSVAPVAATKTNDDLTVDSKEDSNNKFVSPILVVKNKSLDQSTRKFILDKLLSASGAQQYVIGGLNSLGTDFYRDVDYLKSGSAKRISGDDRYATNANIVKSFYKGDGLKASGLVVASGKNNALVDAEVAGAFAAKKVAPIILAGNTLTSAQTDLLKSKKGEATVFYTAVPELNEKVADNVYQVGGVVSADAMKIVVDKFGL